MSRPDPFISIVIPSYNRRTFLEKNIPELLQLDYDNYEIIVVDDGSTDGTGDIFEHFLATNLHYYKKENGERAAARNYGVTKAQGEYITFLDSDDMLYHDALKNAADALRKKDYPSFLHMAYDIGTVNKVSKTVNDIKDNDTLVMVIGNPLSCMGIFMKREIFKEHRFNEDRQLSGSEDWEFWTRIIANYGLRTDHRVIGRLIEHDSRSVISISEQTLVRRMTLAMKYAFEDPAVQRVYGTYKHTMWAHWYTYTALHLAMDGIKKRAWYFVGQALKQDPTAMMNKRGLVIGKLLLLK